VSRQRRGYRGIWQKRFWEHAVRDTDDLHHCYDYIHYNPVKHGVATCPHAWEWTSFHRFARERKYDEQWCCACRTRENRDIIPVDIVGAEMDT
jgi:putative transposase